MTAFALPAWSPWLLRRLLSGVATVSMLSFVVFVATQALPSDPARVILGPEAPEGTVIILRQKLGLDRPLPEQYARWFGGVLRGDFGRSLDSNVPVRALVARRLGNTLALIGGVSVLAIPLSLLLGVALALYRDSPFDRLVVMGLVLFKAVPAFATATGLVMLLSTSVFALLPAVSLIDASRPLVDQSRYLVLPVLTLVLSAMPYLVRLTRASMIEVLETEYIALARLRGIPEWRILFRHALPNALIPALQGVALMLSVVLGGALVVEVMFSYPGIGSALNAAVQNRDIPVIQALVLIVATGVVILNLTADVLTVVLSPRLRTARVAEHRCGRATASVRAA